MLQIHKDLLLFDDGISAKAGNYRPAFEQMIKDGKAHEISKKYM